MRLTETHIVAQVYGALQSCVLPQEPAFSLGDLIIYCYLDMELTVSMYNSGGGQA